MPAAARRFTTYVIQCEVGTEHMKDLKYDVSGVLSAVDPKTGFAGEMYASCKALMVNGPALAAQNGMPIS